MENSSVATRAWMDLDKLEPGTVVMVAGSWRTDSSPETPATDEKVLENCHIKKTPETPETEDTSATSRSVIKTQQLESDVKDQVSTEGTTDDDRSVGPISVTGRVAFPSDKAAKPTTKASRKRPRSVFSPRQRAALEGNFQRRAYLTSHERKKMAVELGVSETQVSNWYQNRRGRLRKRGPSDEAYMAVQSQMSADNANRKYLDHLLNQNPDDEKLKNTQHPDERSVRCDTHLPQEFAGHTRALQDIPGYSHTPSPANSAVPDVTSSSIYQPLMPHHSCPPYTDNYRTYITKLRQPYHPWRDFYCPLTHYDAAPFIPYLGYEEEHAQNGDFPFRPCCHSVADLEEPSPLRSDCMFSSASTDA